MSYELLVGLHVTNAQQYQQYRQAMQPLLKQYSGGFSYDLLIEETLKPASKRG